MSRKVFTLCVLAIVVTTLGGCRRPLDREIEHEKAQEELSWRVIFDNDGMDVQFLDGEPTPENLLAVRTAPLTNTTVTTVFYCSRTSPLGVYTHDTEVGEVFTSQDGRYYRNATAALIEQGTDALEVVTDFCREQGIEVFWTLRVNDTHDHIHRPDDHYPPWSQLKEENPEWLMGTYNNRPQHGAWSAYDFEVPEVRRLVVDSVAEVCRGYDVDGIHLDFLRHPLFFRDVAEGERATAAQLDMMTAMMAECREVMDRLGEERGRPFLMAVRVPDSPDVCRGMGLDVERWLREGLLDMIIVAEGSMRPWADSVALGNRYGVPVIAGLSESRVRAKAPPYNRDGDAAYRARTAAAHAAGCAGVYLFNLYDAQRDFLSQLHDPALLSTFPQEYFVTVRDYMRIVHYLSGASEMAVRPLLNPLYPWVLSRGEKRGGFFELGDPAGRPAQLGLRLSVPSVAMEVELNGQELSMSGRNGDWVHYTVPAEALRTGTMPFTVEWVEGDIEPVHFTPAEIRKQWERRGSLANCVERLQEDGLLLADRGTGAGDYIYRSFPWAVEPGERVTVDFSVRVLDGSSSLAFANGRNEERIWLEPGRIYMDTRPDLDYRLDTTSRARNYRLEFEGHDYRIYVDGELRIDGRDAYQGRAHADRSLLLLGASLSARLGEAVWGPVTITTSRLGLQDMVLALPESE